MKNGYRKLNGLALLAVVSGVWLGLGSGLAQDEAVVETNAAAVVVEAEPAANDSATSPPESDGEKRWRERRERRNQFLNSFSEHRGSRHREAVVVFGKDVVLKTNETTEAVVVIFGSATVQGKVQDAVVAIGGDVKTEGAEVGDAVVAVMGSVKIGDGSKIHGDVVSVGGGIDVADDATVEGEVQPVDFEGMGLPKLDWLKGWLIHCVFKLRPLAPQVGWVWGVAGAFFLFYLLVAVALPRPVQACVDEMTRRPATTFFMGLLTKLLLPIVLLVLVATGIGVLVVPFLLAALFFGALVGKVAFLEYLGRSIGRIFGTDALARPVLALLVGSALIALLYMVPILGLIVFAVSALWGLGVAVTVGFGSLRREAPARPATAPTAPGAFPAPMQPQPAPMNFGAPGSSPGEAAPLPGTESLPFMSVPLGGTAATGQPVVGEAWTLPRASFWERTGAAFLDMVLVCILGAIVNGPPLALLVWLAYFAGMWAWKGTTIGGIVVNLKVVRLDDQPITLLVAIVRGLAAAFSASVCFLGLFWIAWDKDRQGWHDKIAGTVVVRVPRGRSLV